MVGQVSATLVGPQEAQAPTHTTATHTPEGSLWSWE